MESDVSVLVNLFSKMAVSGEVLVIGKPVDGDC